MAYTDNFTTVAGHISQLMSIYQYQKKDLGYGHRWTFDNKQWFDLIDYTQASTLILRFGRGAWLVRQYPTLASLFDEIQRVIAKFHFQDLQTLEHKNFLGLLKLLSQAPSGVRALD